MSGSKHPVYKILPDAVVMVDRNRSIVHANAHAHRLFGYASGELMDLAIDSLLTKKSRAENASLLEEFFPHATPHSSGIVRQLRGMKKDGREFPLEIAIGPNTDQSSHHMAVVRDLTAVARIPKELRDSDWCLRLAAMHAAETLQYINVEKDLYVWFTDIDGLLGYAPGEFPRTFSGWFELLHPDDVDRIRADIERIIENRGFGWSFRYRIRAKDGSYRYWLDRGTVIGFLDGRPNEGVGAILDETEAVLARQELERALAETEAKKDRLQAESHRLREEISRQHEFEEIVGNSAPLLATLHRVEQVAATDASVLLLGETGTGKGLLARALHERSRRRERPFIEVDCATLPPGLVESELFGHEKGAFTGAHDSRPGRFAVADGGTIFLDEIGDLPLDLQAKLLRVLQDGEFQRLGANKARSVDVRIIAATNRDLQEEVRAERFRSDLFYRLGVFPIEVPPLRDRLEDIPLLTAFFMSRHGKKLGPKVKSASRTTLDSLMSHDWPGNVRELENVVQRALILSPGPELELTEGCGIALEQSRTSSRSLTLDLRGIERKQIIDALEASRWRIKGEGNAAGRLGLKPSTLRSRMKRLGIERPH